MVESRPTDAARELIAALTAAVIANNEEEAAFQGLTLLNKLVENKVKNPEEAKFNGFKKTNPKVVEKILSLQGGINDLIMAMGFTSTSDDRYEFTGDIRVLKKGNRVIDTAIMPMKVSRMTPDDRKKHEILEAQKLAYKVQQASDRERREELLRMSAGDRQEKRTEPVVASKAQVIGSFGAEVHTFKQPPGGG